MPPYSAVDVDGVFGVYRRATCALELYGVVPMPTTSGYCPLSSAGSRTRGRRAVCYQYPTRRAMHATLAACELCTTDNSPLVWAYVKRGQRPTRSAVYEFWSAADALRPRGRALDDDIVNGTGRRNGVHITPLGAPVFTPDTPLADVFPELAPLDRGNDASTTDFEVLTPKRFPSSFAQTIRDRSCWWGTWRMCV
ncbi:hypothetical protein K438DRAFT_1954268 [Mycena galopus ATCC 62051]|nr:hypothetical protein K438DRAFT_1954268 [Mycena galopus ATCC 62051]